MIRVLVVDDKDDNLELLRVLFEGEGWDVHLARHGADALIRARHDPPDLVVADLLMLLMDGYGLLREWQADEQLKAIPFVVHAATYTDAVDGQIGANLGSDALVLTPSDRGPFIDRVRGVVAGIAARRDVPPPEREADHSALLRETNEMLVRRLQAKALELERVNRDLILQKARLRAILDTEPECVKLMTANNEVLEMNPAGLRMIEADSFEEVAKTCVLPLIVEDDRAAFAALTDRVFEGESGILEFGLRGLKGGLRTLETHAAPLRDATGRITAVLAVTRDVSADRAARDALRASEAHFRALSEAAPVGIVLAGPDGHVTYANPALLRMMDLPSEEAMGLNGITAVHPEDRTRLLAEWGDCHFPATCFQSTGRYLHADGTVVWWEAATALITDGDMILGHVGTVADVTERRLASELLQEAQDRLELAVEAGRIGLWDWDLRSDEVTYSTEWKRHIGHADDDLSGGLSEWRDRLHPEDRANALQAVTAYFAADEPDFSAEFRLRHADGSYRHILARASEIRGADGRRIRLVGSHVDLTEMMELRAQVLQSQRMESLGRLAGGVSHDFNNLLTVIGGFADLAMEVIKEGDPLRAHLQEIRRASERAGALTRQLLAFSRRQIMTMEVVDLPTLVAGMEGMLRRIIGEDIAMVLDAASDVGGIKADPGQIEQLIMNLVANARDSMPNGGRLIISTNNAEFDAAHAAEHPAMKPGPHVMLTVTDTGEAMDAAVRARIFEPFFTTKPQGKGTGLGLATVHGIVAQSGGCIHVESEVGKGTTFRVLLPRVEEGASARYSAPERPLARGRTGETILVVEDEDALRHLVTHVLSHAGFIVLEANNGDAAVGLLERHEGRVDLMVTDVVMPGMSGPELASRLATLRPAMKVLFTSGYSDDAVLRHGVAELDVAFLAKPYTATALTGKIRAMLS